MKHPVLIAHLLALSCLAVLSGCTNVPLIRATQLERLEPYSQAKATLPPLGESAIRLYIYRPQTVVGMMGNPIVVVDGQRMGNPSNPTIENLLLPGTVFVVDTPAKPTRVWWEQGGQGDESSKAIALTPEAARTWYLRWDLAPTHGYLQPVPEPQALAQLDSLRLSGYVNLVPK